MGIMDKFEKYAHCHDLPLRVALGVIFITAGFGKLFGEPGLAGFKGMLEGIGLPLAGIFAILVAVTEFGGAIALFLGWYTRYVAGLLAVILVVAILTVKVPQGNFSGMFVDIGMLGAAVSLLFSGSKTFCVDKATKKVTEAQPEVQHFHD